MSVQQIQLNSFSSQCYEINEYDSVFFNRLIAFEMALSGASEMQFLYSGLFFGRRLNLKLIAKYDTKHNLVIQEEGLIKLITLYAIKVNCKMIVNRLFLLPFSSKSRKEMKDVFRSIFMGGIPRRVIHQELR